MKTLIFTMLLSITCTGCATTENKELEYKGLKFSELNLINIDVNSYKERYPKVKQLKNGDIVIGR